jgi:hypothetical protein
MLLQISSRLGFTGLKWIQGIRRVHGNTGRGREVVLISKGYGEEQAWLVRNRIEEGPKTRCGPHATSFPKGSRPTPFMSSPSLLTRERKITSNYFQISSIEPLFRLKVKEINILACRLLLFCSVGSRRRVLQLVGPYLSFPCRDC